MESITILKRKQTSKIDRDGYQQHELEAEPIYHIAATQLNTLFEMRYFWKIELQFPGLSTSQSVSNKRNWGRALFGILLTFGFPSDDEGPDIERCLLFLDKDQNEEIECQVKVKLTE